MKHTIKLYTILAFILLSNFMLAAPTWTVKPNDFEYAMNITGIININGKEYNSANDMVGAFVDDECRGVSKLIKLEKSNRYVALLSVYSNIPMGEEVSFKTFSSSTGAINDVPQKVVFQTDLIIGDPSVPYAFASPELSNETDILEMSFLNSSIQVEIQDDEKVLIVSIPKGVSKTELVTYFTVSDGAYTRVGSRLQESGISTNDFSSPFNYTIIAANGLDNSEWQVIPVDRDLLQSTDFVSFSIEGQTKPALINTSTHTIDVFLPGGTVVTSLKPEFIVQGEAKVMLNTIEQQSGISVVDLTQTLSYNIISEDGENTQPWLVRAVLPEVKKETDILSFTVTGQILPATINAVTKLITVQAPKDFDITRVLPTFVLSDSAKAYVDGALQQSGNSPQDFSSPVIYTIVAEDTMFKADWVVYIEQPPKSQETMIRSFSFADMSLSTDIDVLASRITVTLKKGTNPSELVPEFELSDNAKAYVDGKLQQSGKTKQNFSQTVTYQVVAEDVTIKRDWYVIIQLPELSDEAEITEFSIPEQISPPIFNPLLKRIDLMVAKTTSLSFLIPVFTLSDGASCFVDGKQQFSGNSRPDFSHPVIYEVKAEDGSKKNWTVVVSQPPSSDEAYITSFSLPNQLAPAFMNEAMHRIDIGVPQNTDLTALTPEFELSIGATAFLNNVKQVSGESVVDFSSPIQYRVVAEDGETVKNWAVYVSLSPENSQCQILEFEIPGQLSDANINNSENTIDILLPKDADIASCVPVFTLSQGASASVNGVRQVSNETSVDFTSLVEYQIQSQDGNNTETWTVSAFTLCDTCNYTFSSYIVPDMKEAAFINPVLQTISLKMNNSADLSSLIATFSMTENAKAFINSIEQVSGTTQNDFSSPLPYTVKIGTDETELWEVKAYYPRKSAATDFIAFSVPGQAADAIINPFIHRVDVTLPKGADLSSISPVFSLSENAIAFVGAAQQTSGQTNIDLTQQVIYEIVAEDGTTTQQWTVYTTYPEASSKKDFLQFSLEGQKGEAVINKYMRRIDVAVPKDIDLTYLVATFELSPFASTQINNVIQESGKTAANFSNPVTFTNTAEDGSTSDWLVVVSLPSLSTGTDIIDFSVPNQLEDPVFNYYARSIDITVSASTDLSNLVPEFTLSDGAGLSYNGEILTSGTMAIDFSTTKYFKVTAEDEVNTKQWKVNVKKGALSSQCEILSFSFPTQTSPAVINTNTRQIGVEVSSDSNLESLIAQFTLSDRAEAFIDDNKQESKTSQNNFTGPVVYTIVAEDGGTTKDWIVLVSKSTGGTSDGTSFVDFQIENQIGSAVINPYTHQVSIKVPYSMPLNPVVPQFVLSSGATATVNGALQTSGLTALDFSTPVLYEISAQNTEIKAQWLVVLTCSDPSDKTDFHSFSVPGQIGLPLINTSTHRIEVIVEDSTDRSGIIPVFELSGGASATIQNIAQRSGSSVVDFTGQVIYHVLAEDEKTWFDWVVKVIPKSMAAIEDAENSQVLILSPNPCVDFIKLNAHHTAIGKEAIMFGLNGKITNQFTVTANEMVISTDNFAPGTYFIMIKGKGMVQKFVKK